MASESAWNAGWNLGSEYAGERFAHKQALSDEEFEQHANRLADELASNRHILSTIDPQRNPSAYAEKVADMQQNLQSVRELYHPDRHPSAVSRYGHLVTDALRITDPQKRIQLVAQRRADESAQDDQHAQQLATATQQQPNELLDYKNALIGAGFTSEQAQKALEIRAGIEAKAAPAKLPTETADVRTRADFAAFQKAHPEYKGTFEQWKTEQAAQGRAAVPKTMNRDDRYIGILQKQQAGQALTPDERAYQGAYDLYVQKTKVAPGTARAAAYGANRFIPVIDPDNPENVIFMRAGDAAKSRAGSPQSIAFKTDAAMSKYMTSGVGGRNLNYFVTATNHLQLLKECADALNNGDVQLFNRAANSFAVATGSPAPTNFNSVLNAVAGELAKTFSGVGATQQEIKDITATISNAQSPAQLAGAINMDTRLMQGKVQALQGQFEQGRQGQPNFPSGPTPTPGELKKKAKANLGPAGMTDDEFLEKVK